MDCSPVPAGGVNTDEVLVEPYELPDPLVFENGAAVTRSNWGERRTEILNLFEDHVFGRTPEGELSAITEESETGTALDGAATRRQVRLTFSNNDRSIAIDVLIYVPSSVDGPVPVFLVPNFDGNHTIADDPDIVFSAGATRDRGGDAGPRGSKTGRFPLATILGRGYGLATFYSGDADPDIDDGFANGVHHLYYSDAQTTPEPYEWGTIGAWAWGCSRVLDHLGTEQAVDDDRVIVGGHSRLGKTALWAAAQDKRFAAVFSNNSGCTGAALSRRRFGENVAVINTLFPHWFCRNYRCYGNDEAALPVDQHQLIALVAPRPVHIASASEDGWADPLGEFLAAREASHVYELLGAGGLEREDFPSPGEVSLGPISYHLRDGEHALAEFDWVQYLDFADNHVR
ncbi:MAG: acetylxylan esterase [Actinomycetia bacterium]|nr:acetylxylan esterase [Actinomycetes bacterium]